GAFAETKTVIQERFQRLIANIEVISVLADSHAGGGLSQDIRADASCIGRIHGAGLPKHQRPPVAPALSHASALKCAKSVGIGRAARQSITDAMPILMNDDSGIEVAISLGRGCK